MLNRSLLDFSWSILKVKWHRNSCFRVQGEVTVHLLGDVNQWFCEQIDCGLSEHGFYDPINVDEVLSVRAIKHIHSRAEE